MVKIIRILFKFFFALGLLLLFLIGLLWNGYFLEVPSKEELNEFKLPEASEIYSSDSVLLGKIYFENRK